MQDFSNRRDEDHLIKQILNRNGDVPNYALLVGAGASRYSGVDTADEMISRWRRELYIRDGSKGQPDEWLKGQYWYGDEDEYAILFETMYDEPVQRRNFIEDCLKDARPNWG